MDVERYFHFGRTRWLHFQRGYGKDSVRVIHIGNRSDTMERGKSQSLFLVLSDRLPAEPEHWNCGPEDGGIT